MLRLESGGVMALRIVGVSLVCALAVGCGGENGKDGEDGLAWLTAAVPASAADCPNGGTTVQVGPDTNRNGTLDAAEVSSSSPVCNGADGDPSALWLVATEEADTDRCDWGGTIVHTGKDTNGSEVLEPSEFLSTQPICKSAVAASVVEATWTGNGTDNKLSNPDNWAARRVPLEGQTLIFPDEGARKTLENDLPLATTFGALSVGSGYQFSGKKIVVLDSISVSTVAGSPVTMAWPMVIHGATLLVDSDGAAGDELVISGPIEGLARIVKQSAGTVALSGTNTFRGGVAIQAGGVRAVGGDALPDFSDVDCLAASNLFIEAAGETVLALGGNCTLTLGGPLVIDDDEDRVFGGVTLGAGALIKRGSGFLALTGSGATHTGPLQIEQGGVILNNDYGVSPVTIASGATLAGNGNPGAITVASGGIVAPGGAGDAAILTSSSNVSFAAGATLAIEINGTVSGTGYDRLAANGDVALGGATLTVDMGFSAVDGNAFTIVQCTGALTGTFAGIPDLGFVTFEGQRFVVDYTASSVVLTRDDP